MPLESRVVSEIVSVPAETAYAFARRMENLPQWAAGLACGIEQRGGEWFTDSPMGKVKVAMAAENSHGVLDHDVTLPNGVTVHNALRVTPAGDGCVLTFIVLRMPGTTQVAFEDDAAQVQRTCWHSSIFSRAEIRLTAEDHGRDSLPVLAVHERQARPGVDPPGTDRCKSSTVTPEPAGRS